MKKLVLTITAIAGFVFMASAQEYGFEKGNVLLEGSIQAAGMNDRNSGNKDFSFSFTPKVGYFLSDRFALGLMLGVSTFTQEKGLASSVRDYESKSRGFDVGTFGRYYFLEVGSRFKTYAELNATFGFTKSHYEVSGSGEIESKSRGFGSNAGVGANYFLTERIAVNFHFANLISYTTFKPVSDNPNFDSKSTSAFTANLNIFNNFFETARFGLTFKF